jgi:hypothetical protein
VVAPSVSRSGSKGPRAARGKREPPKPAHPAEMLEVSVTMGAC